MMEPFVRNFIRASLVWLGVGVLIGLSMAFFPARALVYRPAHVHANLLGFVSMMIFGVAYHVIPRFTGNPLHSRALALTHLWAANLGLALLVGGWIVRALDAPAGSALVEAGAALTGVAMTFFIYNLWRTLGPRRVPAGAHPPLSGAVR
jgi:cytochrome c oxidase cbb3-type subunit 1